MDLLWKKTGKANFQLSVIWYYFVSFKNILLVNSEGPDQTPHFVASDLGLHCLSLSVKLMQYLCSNAYSCVIYEDFSFGWYLHV